MYAVRQYTYIRHLRLATSSRNLLSCRHVCNISPGSKGFSISTRVSTKIRVGPGKDSFAKARFTAADVPSLHFWATKARPPLVGDLSPEECLATAQRYTALALREPVNWRQNLATQHGISLYTLHHIANMIITGPPSPAWNLATHILYTNVQLSYTPSILTMVRLSLKRDRLEGQQFSPAQDAFERLLARRDDPDACTLKGLVHAAKNTREADNKALEWFQLARRIGGEEPQAWDWQSSCIMGLAKIYLKQNKTKQAKDTLHYAAVTLDIPEACWLYAITLSEDDANRPSWLKKAAVSGIPAASRELAQAELRRLNDESLSKGEMVEKQALADEWLGIAGDKALY